MPPGAATMDTVKGKETQDQSVKNLLIYKPIMGNILKYTVEEYKDCYWKKSWNADAQKNQSNKHHLHQSRPLIVRYPGGFLHRKELENVEKCRTYYIAC